MNSGTWIVAPGSSVAGLGPPGARYRGGGRERGRVGPAGRAVALGAGVGLADGQLDGRGHVHVQRRAVVERDRDRLLLEQVVRGVADHGGGDPGLVVVLRVHEHEVGALTVQVLHLAAVYGGHVDLDAV